MQHRGGDPAAARRAGDEKRLAVLEHDGWRHRRQRPLAGTGLVGFGAKQAEGVRRIRFGGKIIELVIEQNAGILGDQADAIAEIERIGICDGVAETVDHGKMRRVAAFGRHRAAGTDIRRRGRPDGIDASAPAGRIIFRGQQRDRVLHAIRIAEKQGAIGISALHRFDQQMQGLRFVGMGDICQIVAFKDVEHLDERDAAGGRRRHRNDFISAIGAAHRHALDRSIIFQVVGRHDPAGARDGGGNFLRDRPLVERARAVTRNCLQRIGKVLLHQTIAGAEHAAVRFDKNLDRCRPARQPRQHIGQRIRGVVADRDAVARQRDRRRNQFGEAEFSRTIFLFGQGQARNGARHADRKRGFARPARIGIAGIVQKAFGVDAARRGLAIIDGRVCAVGQVNDHKAAAADIAGARIADGERKANGNRGIDRIAALCENIGADPGGERLLRHHHAGMSDDALRNDVLRIADAVGGALLAKRDRGDRRDQR